MAERGPEHVAIIMDGNGRWAKERGLPRAEGHRAGVQALRRVVEATPDEGIRYLTVYAFSTENWRRPQEEIDVLMDILVEYLAREVPELRRQGVRLNAIGHTEELPPRCQEALAWAFSETAPGETMTLTLALNYGARRDIVDAVAALVRAADTGEISAAEIDERTVARHLSTRHLPDPDLVIRPSGEERLSNFLLWEAAYAELYLTSVFWPDFDRRVLHEAIEAFRLRHRRFGGLEEEDS